jgi:hypothetical protein
MKKTVTTLIFTCLFSFALTAQEKSIAWDYPVKPGTEGWQKLKTIEEQFNVYNIPADILKKISTEELVKTCLSYPEWGLITAYNSRQTGLSVLVSLFNGFRELLSRDAAAIALIKEYSKLNPTDVSSDWTDLQKGQYSFEFTRIEMFLMQNVIVNRLDEEQLQILKELAVSQYKKKKMLPEIYSLWDLSPTAGICLAILRKEKNTLINNDRAIKVFMYELMTDNVGLLDKIVELLTKN